jgi:hypothetical protein
MATMTGINSSALATITQFISCTEYSLYIYYLNRQSNGGKWVNIKVLSPCWMNSKFVRARLLIVDDLAVTKYNKSPSKLKVFSRVRD